MGDAIAGFLPPLHPGRKAQNPAQQQISGPLLSPLQLGYLSRSFLLMALGSFQTHLVGYQLVL